MCNVQTSKNFSEVMGNKLTFSILSGFSECSAVGETMKKSLFRIWDKVTQGALSILSLSPMETGIAPEGAGAQ